MFAHTTTAPTQIENQSIAVANISGNPIWYLPQVMHFDLSRGWLIQRAMDQAAERVVHAPVIAEGNTSANHGHSVLIAGFRCLELKGRAVTDRVWIGRVLEVIE
tara:strand:+ start:157 stop:468 length:312 start_codon:yes stop_codon:yes gene_type:complete